MTKLEILGLKMLALDPSDEDYDLFNEEASIVASESGANMEYDFDIEAFENKVLDRLMEN